jgi:hypothetical protein
MSKVKFKKKEQKLKYNTTKSLHRIHLENINLEEMKKIKPKLKN